MKYLPLFYCLLSVALAVREKQLGLEDIERDNLASERRVQHGGPRPAKEQPHVPQQYISAPQPALQLQQYLSAPQNLGLQQQYLSNLQLGAQQQYITIPQAEIPQQQQQHISIPQPVLQQQQQQQQQPQYRQPITPPKLQYGFKPMKTQPQSQPQPQQAQRPPQYSPSQQHFNLPQQFFTYQPTQQQTQYIQPSRAQQYVQSHPNYQQLQLPYITDNNLAAQDTNAFQQYYQPQYVYLQQYPSASDNVQTVVDPKGGFQYVMYVPSQYLQGDKGEQTQTVETVLQSQDQVYTQDLSAAQGSVGGTQQQYQYIEVPQAEVQPQVQIEPQLQVPTPMPKFTDIQYVQQQPEIQKSPTFPFPSPKYQPKSLLDSYVPSILQIQYFKQQQQQAQANAIRQPSKSTQAITGKGGFTKNYVPQESAAQSYNFQYSQFASHPTKVVKH